MTLLVVIHTDPGDRAKYCAYLHDTIIASKIMHCSMQCYHSSFTDRAKKNEKKNLGARSALLPCMFRLNQRLETRRLTEHWDACERRMKKSAVV